MSNSRPKRYKKRLQVRFWREGEEQPHSGYTTNVSMEGMFVATNTPVTPNERVRVEILDETRGFVVQGTVVHAARVSPLLMKLRQAGMGIRLLGIDEMIGALVGRKSERVRKDVEFRVDAPMGTGYDERPNAAPAQAASISDREPPVHPKDPDSQSGEQGFPETVSPADPTLFSIRFETVDQFMDAFRREIQHGGMFITTEHPPEVNQEVTVEIDQGDSEPVSLEARVVSRRDAAGARPPGINVDFKDLKSALERLNRLREWAAKDERRS